ncbi:MAG TPA: NADH-quinone oxidoreductase subunit A [Fimbriimonadales bacterium]|nr:NADH-quinone oxidoreductase subunit A [Fimbriimonadales bacterium]
MNPYVGIVILLIVGGLLCAMMVLLSTLLGPKKSLPYKEAPYECGVMPEGTARQRFPIKFYLTAMLFILFDIEVVFLWSWMTVFLDWVKSGDPAATYSFWAVLLYMFLWFLGDAYVLRSGALKWEEAVTLHPEKLGAIAETPLEEDEMVYPKEHEKVEIPVGKAI